jgi:hypothetical protein
MLLILGSRIEAKETDKNAFDVQNLIV